MRRPLTVSDVMALLREVQNLVERGVIKPALADLICSCVAALLQSVERFVREDRARSMNRKGSGTNEARWHGKKHG